MNTNNNEKKKILPTETLKVCIIGESSTGKSCLLTRWADDSFSHSNASTIGVDFRFRTLTSDKRVVKLQVWDTAGQERFKNVTRAYFRGSHGFIICFDLTSMESFENCDYWFEQTEEHQGKFAAVKVIVGNKSDLVKERKVDDSLAREYAAAKDALYFECSSLENKGIDELFLRLTKEMISNKKQGEEKPTLNPLGIKLSEDWSLRETAAQCCKM